MLEIKDEDRIIGKICRGEISITDRDIKNLATANLDEAHEENFRKLAQEINETLERNQNLRKEMKEQIEFVEKDYFVKDTLSKVDAKINELKSEYNKKRNIPLSKIMLGTMLTLILGMGLPMLASIFSSSLWVLGTATFVGFFTGVGIDLGLIVKSQNKLDEIQKQIKSYENDRLNVITDGEIDLSKTEEAEVKSNIVKFIYKEREKETTQENDLNNNL